MAEIFRCDADIVRSSANEFHPRERPSQPRSSGRSAVLRTALVAQHGEPTIQRGTADEVGPFVSYSPLSRFDEMREEAFAKSSRPLESQFIYERRPPRGLLATAGAIAAAIGVTVILALVLFNVFPRSKSDPSELAVSISTPASATPAQVTSDNSQALLEGFKQFQKTPNESLEHPVSDPASLATAKEGPEKSQALLEKFIQWQQRK
ncbi:hypothetical protein ACF1BQ_018230 [Bradyrhizobium sp. RDT10]